MSNYETPEGWTDEQNAVFSRMYSHMLDNQPVMTHPKADTIPQEHWNTVCWNAAWMAVILNAGCAPIEHIREDGRTLAVEGRGPLQ